MKIEPTTRAAETPSSQVAPSATLATVGKEGAEYHVHNRRSAVTLGLGHQSARSLNCINRRVA